MLPLFPMAAKREKQRVNPRQLSFPLKASWDRHKVDCRLFIYPVASPKLWYIKLALGELSRKVTHDDTSRVFETCLAIMHAVMLPHDVVELHKELE